MKTITKRFLKASVAMLLVVIMLFGTTISGFAAVVDKAQTKWSISGKLYYLDTANWGSCYLWIKQGNNEYWYEMTKIDGTGIYRYPHADWNNYTMFKFAKDKNWSAQSSGNIEANASNVWYNGTSTTQHSTLSQMSATAKVVTMISTDGGNSYVATKSSEIYTTVSGKSLITAITAASDVSSSTSNTSSSASIEAAYGSIITYTANAGSKSTFKGFSTTDSDKLPSDVSSTSTYTKKATGYGTSDNNTVYAYYVMNPKATFVDWDGTELSSGYVTSGTQPTAPEAPTRDGYIFLGWSNDGGTTITGVTSITADTTFTAVYERSTVNAKFEDWDGKELKSEDIEPGTTPTPPPAPTREGYTFTGWNPEVDAITQDTVYVAQYTINTYNLTMATRVSTDGGDTYTVNSAGGTAIAYEGDDETKTITQYEYNKEFNIKAVANTGYRFAGWSDDQNPDQIKSTNAATTGRLKRDNTVYYANFVKTENVNIDITDGVDSITYSYGNVTETVTADKTITVDAGTMVTFTKTIDEDNYTADGGKWNHNGTEVSSESITLTVGETTDVFYTPIKTWAVTVTESEADKGTVLLGGEEVTSATVNNGGTITLEVTPVANHVASVTVDGNPEPLVDGKTTLTITKDTAVVVTYTDVSCKLEFPSPSISMNLGETNNTQVVEQNQYCEGHTVTYKSSDETVATVDENTGLVTAIKPGTITITATCSESTANASYTLVVNEPTVEVNKDSIKLFPGHGFTAELTLDSNYNASKGCSIAWAVNDTGATAITLTPAADNLSVGILAGANILTGGVVTATVTYSTGYTKTVTINVDIITPSVTPSKKSISLEYGSDSDNDSTTFTLSNNFGDVEGTCDLDSVYQVESSDPDVAEVQLSGSTVTVRARGIGTANVIIKYHNTQTTVPVNVEEFEDDFIFYLYVGSSYSAWTDVRLHLWDAVESLDRAKMAKIGWTKDSDTVWAIKVPRSSLIASGKTTGTFKFKFVADGNWTEETIEYSLTIDKDDPNIAYHLNGYNKDNEGNNKIKEALLGNNTFNISNFPTLTVDPSEITVGSGGGTATVSASHTGTNGIDWAITDTKYASISGSTNSGTVTGKEVGSTELKVCSFVKLSPTDSIYSINKADKAAWDFIGTTVYVDVEVVRGENDKRVDVYLSQGLYTMVGGVTAEIVGQTVDETLTSNKSSGNVENHEKANFYDNKELLGSVIEIKYTESNEDYEVAYIVVYNFNEQMFKIYEAEDMGTYVTAHHLVTDSCYIYPVFFHTEEFITTNKLKKLTFSFDTTELPVEEWGMFVSCYSYDKYKDSNNAEHTHKYFGEWPGQLMIPNEAGTRFWTQIEVPDTKQGSTYAYQPDGILFSNYLDGTIPQKYSSAFGFETSTCLQTYDYREGVTLLEEGYDEIFFKAQKNEDGYHGDNPSGSYDVSDNSTFNAKTHSPAYTYEYLLHRDQVHAMDFFGQVVPDAEKDPLNNADYYIISEGDVDIAKGGYKRPGSNGAVVESEYNGVWSVLWHVYGSDGKHLVTMLSDAFYNEDGSTNDVPVLVQELMKVETGKNADDYRGVTIAISYEKENNNNHAGDCYDGQWYGIRSTDTMDVSVEVGLIPKVDDQGVIEQSLVGLAGSNDSYYGKGGIVSDSDLLPTKQLTYGGDRSVDLKANKVGNYKFVGWYEFDGSEYCRIDTAPTHTIDRVPNTITYYALFEELGETDVIITHAKYNNQYTDIANEPVQEHNGDSLMSVTVYDNVDKKYVHDGGTASMTSTTATFTAVEGHTYTVTITTVPVAPDTFFAWYSDSLTADNKPTYEEVFTREEDNGSSEMVSNTFIYDPAKNKNKEINIYSDLVNVTADATLEYVYQNRYGATRVIRETIHLTDEEILGFAGNYDKKSGKNIPYCPAFNNYYFYDKNTIYYDKDAALENGKQEELNTGNQIIEHAPNKLVTEAVHQNISWNAEETRENRLTVGPSLVTLIADQPPVQYEVTYKIGDEQAVSTGKLDYNTLLDITAPISQNDVSFSYWIDLKTGEIISYNPYYAYRIVEDRDIQAVYGATNYDPWTSVIENVTQTREYQNYPKVTDIVYVDFLLAFHNNKQLRLNDLGDSVQYGLVMIREDGVEVNDSNKNSVAYPSTTTSDNIISKVETVVSRNLASARFKNTAQDTYYYATHYNLTGSENVTNLNRVNFVLSFDNNGTEYYKRAFSAYAYIIADGKTYISKVNDFNIYETATEKLTLSTIGG